jgi:hypothetical protein
MGTRLGWWLAWLSMSTLASADGPGIVFREVAEESGVKFRHEGGGRGKHDLPEIMGGGVALIDADGDGRLDVYLTNGGPIAPAEGMADPPCRLYLNRGGWRFEDATDRAGAPGPSYAMGTAVGDYDGDGRDDLLVTGWRDLRLYRNLGSGRFEDATEKAGLRRDGWSTSAAFADLDGDGDLDLYVCRYLEFDPSTAPFCGAPDGRRDFCGPEVFPAESDRLYRNDGDGTFTDVSREAKIDLADGRGLGVLIADMTGDSRPDIYVANDGTACWLFENKGGLLFDEVGALSSVSFNESGGALAAMGVARGDLDGDGLCDLLASNFYGRSTIAFLNVGRGCYLDSSTRLGLAAATREVLGFGLGLADFDGDGDPDLLQANGHVSDRARLGVPSAMRATLLRNDGGRLVDASGTAGPFFRRALLGRGLAVGDLDGDGRPDAVVAALDSPASVLRNVSPGRGVTVELVGKGPGGRSAVGARLTATVGGRPVSCEVVGGGSYLSAPARELHVGLGRAARIDRLEVEWPSGRAEVWAQVAPGPVVRLVEGTGAAVRP